MKSRRARLAGPVVVLTATVALLGCPSVRVEPIEVKPIHVTLDINIRVQRELEDLFSFEEEYAESDETDEIERQNGG